MDNDIWENKVENDMMQDIVLLVYIKYELKWKLMKNDFILMEYELILMDNDIHLVLELQFLEN